MAEFLWLRGPSWVEISPPVTLKVGEPGALPPITVTLADHERWVMIGFGSDCAMVPLPALDPQAPWRGYP